MKRIVKILTVFFIPLILLQLSSCNEEWLDPNPKSFYAPENVYINISGFEAALVTVRRDLKEDFYGDRGNLTISQCGTDIGDMVWQPPMTQLTPTGGLYTDYIGPFGEIYGFIKNINVPISRINDIEWESKEDRNEILAEAIFYRSYWYNQLTHMYGDVPFVAREIKEPKLDFKTHSKFAVLERIQSDLEWAVDWLPESPPKYKPSKYAGLMLLAKIYLANTEFEKAKNALTTVIDEGGYSLMRERFGSVKDQASYNVLWDLHRPENKALAENTESIFLLIDRGDAPAGAMHSVGTYSYRNWAPTWWLGTLVHDSEGKAGTMTTFPDGTNTPQYVRFGRGNPDQTTTPWFNYELWNDGVHNYKNTPDLRRADSNWIDNNEILYNNPSSVNYGEPLNPEWFADPGDTLMSLFPFPYYKIHIPHVPEYEGRIMGGHSDWYVFRLAEAYLMRAEAYYWLDQPGDAANDINVVRERANAIPVSASDIDIDFIFDERARELYLEEHRKNELVRASYIMAQLGRNGYNMDNFSQNNWFYDRVMDRSFFYQQPLKDGTYTMLQEMEPYHVHYPIPHSIVADNTKGVINQNEGY